MHAPASSYSCVLLIPDTHVLDPLQSLAKL